MKKYFNWKYTSKCLFFCLLLIANAITSSVYAQKTVERWNVFELELKCKVKGNPFQDVTLEGVFANGSHSTKVYGFYDGNNVFRVRFMPDKQGKWTYIIKSNIRSLNKKGSFICTAPIQGNHGRVRVVDKTHFEYDDGTPFYPFGTTCYAWLHQPKQLMYQTIKTLSEGYFNKIRMCIFPKSYDWNKNEPIYYPYRGKPLKNWDYSCFNPVFFQNIEKQIKILDSLGIQADLIIFHPYDRWGFSSMGRENDKRYLKYILARFSAYKNVWWSLANEYDFIKSKKKDDWKYYLSFIKKNDPYNHLRSIHYGMAMFDYKDSDITHLSLQMQNTDEGQKLLDLYEKPVIFDECRYEGNLPYEWGDITAKEMVNKFWVGICRGAFVTHGETYLINDLNKRPQDSDEIMWWSKGGVLHGESPERIKFLRKIIESSPGQLSPCLMLTRWLYPAISHNDDYFLLYFGNVQPVQQLIDLPSDKKYGVDIIDAWNMTITHVTGEFSGKSLVVLPGKSMIALRITRIAN